MLVSSIVALAYEVTEKVLGFGQHLSLSLAETPELQEQLHIDREK